MKTKEIQESYGLHLSCLPHRCLSLSLFLSLCLSVSLPFDLFCNLRRRNAQRCERHQIKAWMQTS